MAINWSKYGIGNEEEKKKENNYVSKVNWDKYTPEGVGGRYVSQMRTNPDLLNPSNIQSNMENMLSSRLEPKAVQTPQRTTSPSPSELLRSTLDDSVFASAAKEQKVKEQAAKGNRQSLALNSPVTKAIQKTSDAISKLSPITNLLPAPKEDTVGRRLASDAMDFRKDVRTNQMNDPMGRFLGGVDQGASMGLTSYLDRITGDPETAEQITQTTAGKVGEFGGMLMPGGMAFKLAKGIKPLANLSNPWARNAAIGGAAGGIFETGAELGQAGFGTNDQSLPQRLVDVGLGTALGAGGDVALFAGGRLLRNARNAASDVVGGQLQAANAIESASRSVPTSRLNVSNNTDVLNKIMTEIKPIVSERMTPPLENPNELAKWLKPHLGDISLNEMRRLPYEDMRQLASEVQKSMNVYDTAKVVAREKGHNLDALLNNETPTLKQAAERLRMGGIAGAIEPPKNARVAIRSDMPVTEAPKRIENPKEPWFNKLFGSSSMGITPGAKDGKTLVDTHIVSRSKERGPIIERVGDAATAANENFVDRFAPFNQINKETYDAAMDSTRANNLANITIKDKFVDLEGNVLGKSLKEVYENVPRGMKNIADRYTIARDAVSRMDRGLNVYGKEKWFPQTAGEAANMVADLEKRYPWLKNFGEDWNQFNRNRQDLWAKSGIASDDLIKTLRHTNPNYAPMMRQQAKDSLKNRLAFNSKSGFSGQKAPIQRAVGSTKKIVEPARGMIESTGASYNAMLRNRAMVNLYDAVKANPERYKGVIDIVEETADMKQASLKAINEALEDNGPDGVAAMLNDELNGIFKRAKQATGNSEATVTVMLNGNPVKMRVSDPSLLKAIEGIAPEQLGGIVKVFNVLSKGIKQAATGTLAPLQGLKLALRDLPIAAAQSKDKKRFITDISHAMISQVGDWLPSFVPGSERLGRLAREYYRAGGGYEAYLKGDSRLRAISSDLTRDPILSGRNLLKTARQANPLKPFKAFGDAMENVPRIAAFSAEMRKNGWKRDPESVRAAIDAGREATVNWSRRGAKGSEIEAFLPYSNAAVQGTYRLMKRFREQPISATSLILAVAGSKIAAYEQFKDDPDYQQRSKFEKGIPISKTADGKFVTVPVEPTEAYIADQILHFYKWAMDGEKAPSVKENIQEGADAFLPKYVAGPIAAFTSPGEAFSPTAAVSNTVGGSVGDPINALTTGKNFFGGDIVPREYQDSSKAQQYNETTSAAGKWAAENLGIDAFTFDYLGQRFGGDIAKVGLPMTSQVGSGDPVGNVWDETLTRLKLLEDPVMKNRISDDFFSYSRSATEARTDHSKKDIPLPEWYQAAYDEVTSTKKGSIASRVQDLNTLKKEYQRSLELTAKQRSDNLRDVQREINLLRLEGIKRLEELGVPKTRE